MNKKSDQEKPVSDNTDNIYQEEIVLDDHVEVDGLLRYFIHHCKDDKPKPYNLRWLSVAAIELELDAAFYGADATSRLLHHVLDTETQGANLFCRISNRPQEGSARSRASLLSWGGTKSPEIENLKTRLTANQYSFRTEIYKKFFNATPTPSYLLQDADEKIADLIHSTPEKLLQESEVQDAFSRWTYAAGFSPETDTRRKARKYIHRSTVPKAGRPKKTPPSLLKYRNAPEVLASLIQEGDKELASLIKSAPKALLKSYQAADGFCRWLYASVFYPGTAIQNQAKEYIKTSVPPQIKRPNKVNPNLLQLLMAYDDLRDYCKCVQYVTENLGKIEKETSKKDVGRIYKAGDKTIYKSEDIEKLFPEVRRLKVGDRGFDINQALDPEYRKFNKHKPSVVAFECIAAFCGLSVSSVENYISKARKEARKIKASKGSDPSSINISPPFIQ